MTRPTPPSKPPTWLAAKPIALAKWHELLEQLISRRLVAPVDLDLFALYCDAWQSLSDADEEIAREGLYFTTEKGYVGIHPAKLSRDKAIEVIQKLADRLGIGINKRKGLKVIEPGDGDEGSAPGDKLAAYAKKKPRPRQ